jgi:predicted RNase H-like nuclease (RuvC/YqgF family)
METKKETKNKKAPAMKASKANPEIESLKILLNEKEAIIHELDKEVNTLERQLHEHNNMVEELWNEVSLYKKASFLTKLKNLFR